MEIIELVHPSILKYINNDILFIIHYNCISARSKKSKAFKIVSKRNDSFEIYISDYSTEYFIAYHNIVMREMSKRGMDFNQKWWHYRYRGFGLNDFTYEEIEKDFINDMIKDFFKYNLPIFSEHDKDCLKSHCDIIIKNNGCRDKESKGGLKELVK